MEDIWGKKGESLSGSKLPAKYSILTFEEKQIIAECQDEGFLYRAVPFSLYFAFSTHLLIKTGVIKLNLVKTNIGRLSLLLGSGVVGFCCGQLSYSNICRDKFLSRVPGGVVATHIRTKNSDIVPYSIFSPLNQLEWRNLAKQRELRSMHEKFEPGFEIDDEFKDQNVLSPNMINDNFTRDQVGPVRYGIFKKPEEHSKDS